MKSLKQQFKDNNKISFIRKNGRIIPIRMNKRQLKERDRIQKKNLKNLVILGASAGGAIALETESSRSLFKSNMFKNQSKALITSPMGHSRKIQKKAMGLFSKSINLKKRSLKFSIASAVLSTIGGISGGVILHRTKKFGDKLLKEKRGK